MNRVVQQLREADEFSVFARNLFFEARGESDLGIVAVGWVVLNRMDDPRWARPQESLKTIILQRNQFSWTRSDDPQNRWALTPWKQNAAQWERAQRLARLVLNGCVPDPTKGANHYLNVQACRKSRWGVPRWYQPAKVTAVIGRHTFLRL